MIACGRQKVKGGHGSSSASSQCIKQCIKQCINHHPEPRSGLCPELLADFRIPKPPGCSQGRRGQFSVQSDNRFSGRGGGVGSLPRAWRRVGVPSSPWRNLLLLSDGSDSGDSGSFEMDEAAEGKNKGLCYRCTSGSA